MRKARLAHAKAKSNTPLEYPVFRVLIKDESVLRRGIDANLPRPEATGHATSAEVTKSETSRLVAADPAFMAPELFVARKVSAMSAWPDSPRSYST